MGFVTPANVIVGVANMYIGTSSLAMPVESVLFGGAWPTGWVGIGATEAGVTLTIDKKTVDIDIEEQSTPVDVVTDTTDVNVGATLSEDTIANMQSAYGGGTITVTTATATLPATSILTLQDALEQVAVGFEALNSFGLCRRVYVPIAISAAKVNTSYRRAKGARLYPITIRAICPPNLITITDATAPPT